MSDKHLSFYNEVIEPCNTNDLRYSPLDKAIDWFRYNMKPEDVFTSDQLKKWAYLNNLNTPNNMDISRRNNSLKRW